MTAMDQAEPVRPGPGPAEQGIHPQVKRLLRSPDGGATDLVLREMTE